MLFSCFHPITGGRVGEIIAQESKWRKDKDALPLSRNEDKFEKFCETYKDYIDVAAAYETFLGHWAKQKSAAGEALLKASAECDKLDLDSKDTVKHGSMEPELKGKAKYSFLLRALLKSFYGDLLKAVFSKLVWSILVIFSIWFFVFEILEFIKLKEEGEVTEEKQNYELYLCAGFFVTMVALSVGIQQMGVFSTILGSKVKGALTSSIYKKMIIRDAFGSKADVVSLVAKDVEKLAEACLSLQYLWSGIFETFAVFGVIFFQMGSTIVPGVVLMCVFLPLQYYLGMIVAFRKKHLNEVSDHRISLMEEIMRSIKLIKIYGWEAPFFKNLNEVREEEAILLGFVNRVKSLILGLIFCLPPMMSLVIFGTQEATGSIEPVVVFTTLSFFNTLRVPFSKLPKSLRDVLDAYSCLERIQHFLLEPDLDMVVDDMAYNKENAHTSSDDGIVFQNASLSYGHFHGAKMVLTNINLNIPQGSLMMVAGPVASGKSNLLKSILGDLTVRKGTCSVSHSKAYVPQTPWTALGTVRDNILFGKPYDEAFYHKVLHACALERDLEIMADGDKTWIGERGGNLSGGQKQRIALARAAYSRAKLYVLDSPLSAVDMYTCQHIFKFCIEDLMIGSGGTVVLATHQTELFPMSDHLVVMEGGMTVYNGKYTYDGVKHMFPTLSDDAKTVEAEAELLAKHETVDKQDHSTLPKCIKALEGDDICPNQSKKPQQSTKKPQQSMSMPKSTATKEYKESVYVWYIKQMGVWKFTSATLIFIIAQVMRVYSDAWVSIWTKRKYTEEGYTTDAFYAGLYLLLVIVFLCGALLRVFYWFYCGKGAANKIHDSSFGAALKAPMHFFHVTPIGKLLSYFSHDVDVIDDVLVDNSLMLQIFTWILLMALGVVAYNLPMFLAIVGSLTIVYVYIVRVYIVTSAPLKKEAGKSQSEVVAHTAETLSGLAVVRAFNVQERFLSENLKFQARSTVVTFSIANLSLWLAFRVDIIGSLLVLCCCLLALFDTSMDASVAGLIVSNSFQILLFFSIMSRTMGELHDNMKAVDEARKMSDLEAEHEPAEEVEPPTVWPSKGEIKFEDVVMPYLPNMPPVLKGINFSVREGEKIGVVGRTGAGKSSLIVALYRLAEISEGKIHVDSVDCSTVSLNKLRSSMAIIPQEPVMFGGTLRTNLDPFNQRTDEELMDVLHKCLLGPVVDADEYGLQAKVEVMGSNYSLGTQQLICLARAMLNPSRILLLDEATAALDSNTNAAVQEVLKAHFSDRTIFTIAHRLDTIIDSDRILTMDAGVVAEFAHPHELLENPDSIFHELCMNAGKAQFEVLAARARSNFHAGDEISCSSEISC